MPTIRDVARHAGVSTATVSRALANPSRVKAPLRELVEASVELLGYQPNVAARSLRTLRSSKLLITVPDISNVFFSKVIRGAEEAARQAGYAVVLGDTRNDPAIENEYALMLKNKTVDGLLLLGHRVPAVLKTMFGKSALPPVVNGCEHSMDLGVPSVHIDNIAAGRDAIAYLTSIGHRRIALITGPLESPLSRDRLQGAQRAAAEAGLDPLPHSSGDFSIQSGIDSAERLLAKHQCTALFCFSDEVAMGAIDAVMRLGLECPRDVSVMGFDDIRFARVLRPPLTTITQPATEIGREAVRLLIQTIENREISPRHIVLRHELIVRQSTAGVR